MASKLSFHGGAGGVTGANYLLEADGKKILVDCGLFQGGRFAEEQNRQDFPYDPRTIDACLITHAHADHIGRLPKLYHDGFRGPVYATAVTRDLAAVMLEDALHIIRYECEQECREPLYEAADVEGVLALFQAADYGMPFSIGTLRITTHDTAHILGSCMFEVETTDGKITFTGDLGNCPTPLLKSIHPIRETDYLLMESVYGDHVRESREERIVKLERILEQTIAAGGTTIIPVFALERTQEVLAELNHLIENGKIPRVPTFLDSPLAIKATAVFRKYWHLFNDEAQKVIRDEEDGILSFPGLTLCPTRDDSKKINDVQGPKIILAGNPHGYGSRIAHHFRRVLPDPNSAVIFVGYARISSMGRALVDGKKTVRMYEGTIPVRAKIENIAGYSAHADQAQLLDFVRGIEKGPRHVFVTMGEADVSQTFAALIRSELGISASAPMIGDEVELAETVAATDA